MQKIELENSLNAVNLENTQRRIMVSPDGRGRERGTTAMEIQEAVTKDLPLQEGYYLQWGNLKASNLHPD